MRCHPTPSPADCFRHGDLPCYSQPFIPTSRLLSAQEPFVLTSQLFLARGPLTSSAANCFQHGDILRRRQLVVFGSGTSCVVIPRPWSAAPPITALPGLVWWILGVLDIPGVQDGRLLGVVVIPAVWCKPGAGKVPTVQGLPRGSGRTWSMKTTSGSDLTRRTGAN